MLLSPPFVLTGDFNSHHTSLGGSCDTPQGATVVDWIIQKNICRINTCSPTHLYAGGSSLLDLTITSPDLFAHLSFVVYSDPFDSDHCPIKLQLDIRTSDSVQHNFRYRCDWRVASSHLNEAMANLDKGTYNDFHGMCQAALKASSRRMRILDRTGSPWWDSRCSYLLDQKRKWLRKARKNLCLVHWA